jgi:hypothetical protein
MQHFRRKLQAVFEKMRQDDPQGGSQDSEDRWRLANVSNDQLIG